MENTIIGFRCKDFVMLSAAGTNTFYYIKICDNQDNIAPLDSHKMIAACGDAGPRNNFVDLLQANLALKKTMLHGVKFSTNETAQFIRGTLADALRSEGGAYSVNSLLAGYDLPLSEFDDTPASSSLYYFDYLGTLCPVNFAAHGYGATFVTAILDEKWREDLTPQAGIDLMQVCINEVKRRVITNSQHFVTKVVSATGTDLLANVH